MLLTFTVYEPGVNAPSRRIVSSTSFAIIVHTFALVWPVVIVTVTT
ncbi:MAG: hypothetical protein WCC30_02255 [Candidatus Dormiibacterota bacterium]